jgi:anthranilate synthase/aminodeoxychorismate synthase-like glutamine amidotransferase
VDVAKRDSRPILGICLGHQAIGVAFGAEIVRAARPVHGKTSAIFHDGLGIFHGLPQGFLAARYHSLAVRETSLPAELVVTARSSDGEIMAIRHAARSLVGVQFHPESFVSEHGVDMLENWLRSIPTAPTARRA